jgi:hypothetical protein
MFKEEDLINKIWNSLGMERFWVCYEMIMSIFSNQEIYEKEVKLKKNSINIG